MSEACFQMDPLNHARAHAHTHTHVNNFWVSIWVFIALFFQLFCVFENFCKKKKLSKKETLFAKLKNKPRPISIEVSILHPVSTSPTQADQGSQPWGRRAVGVGSLRVGFL